jgi:hypothetical protein
MHNFFLVCATLGCTVLVLQFCLAIFGLTGHASPELGDPGDLGSIGDGSNSHGGPAGNHHAAVDADGADPHDHHHGFQLVRFLTFQTVVAFLAFFGLGGLASLEAQRSPLTSLAVAFLLGAASFFVVGYLMQSLTRLHHDGSTRIRDALGKNARVYLRIPAASAGDGKVTVSLAGGTVELRARTAGDALPTGATVRVARILDPRTVEVTAEATEVAADV